MNLPHVRRLSKRRVFKFSQPSTRTSRLSISMHSPVRSTSPYAKLSPDKSIAQVEMQPLTKTASATTFNSTHAFIKSAPEEQEIHEALERLQTELDTVRHMIVDIRNKQKIETDIDRLCILIEQRGKLIAHFKELQDFNTELRWYGIGTRATICLSDVAMARLTKILQETGNSIAALSAFGAAIAMSILFGAVRGNMYWFYGAWWCFTFGVVMLGALQIISAGVGSGAAMATKWNWAFRRIALVVVVISYAGVASGLALFAIAVVNYDVSPETTGGVPRIDDGPSATKLGHKWPTWEAKIGYAMISFFFVTFVAALIYRIAPRIQLHNSFSRGRRGNGVKQYFMGEIRRDQHLIAICEGTSQFSDGWTAT